MCIIGKEKEEVSCAMLSLFLAKLPRYYSHSKLQVSCSDLWLLL